MITNCYDSGAFKHYVLKTLGADLELAKAQNQTQQMSEDVHYLLPTSSIASFPAPYLHGGIVYVDAREFSSQQRTGELKFLNPMENQLRFEMASFEKIWQDGAISKSNILSQFPYHVEIFSKWVSSTLQSLYALDPYQTISLQAISALFVVGQYINSVDDQMALRLQEKMCRDLKISFSTFESVTTGTETLFPRNLEEFCEHIIASEISPRLIDISPASLRQALGGGFWGVSNERLVVNLALEYPPAFLALIKTCIENTSLKRSRIGSTVISNNYKNNHSSFLRSYQMLLGRYSAPYNPIKE